LVLVVYFGPYSAFDLVVVAIVIAFPFPYSFVGHPSLDCLPYHLTLLDYSRAFATTIAVAKMVLQDQVDPHQSCFTTVEEALIPKVLI